MILEWIVSRLQVSPARTLIGGSIVGDDPRECPTDAFGCNRHVLDALQRFTRKTGLFVSRGAHLALDDLNLLVCPLEAIP
jgi:hypothetical protein